MTDMRKILILGAGPAGMGVAYHCKKRGIPFRLFESQQTVGGNCRTFNEDGFRYDSGAHRFHDKDSDSTELVMDLMDGEMRSISVPSQIYIDGKFVDFPPSPANLIKFLGIYRSVLEFFNLMYQKLKSINTDLDNFKDLAINKYGHRVSKTFLLNYSEKLWGLPAYRLSTAVAGKRLKGLDIKTLLLEILGMKRKKDQHIDGSFYYPRFGIGTIFSSMQESFSSEEINLNSGVTSIYHQNDKVTSIKINNKKSVPVDILVSSIPVDLFIKLLNPAPPKEILEIAESIRYRDLLLVLFQLDKESVNSNGSMYFPSKEYMFTRIYEPRNRSKYMSPKNKTSLVIEIPCQVDDGVWKLDRQELKHKVKSQMIDIGLIRDSEILGIKIKEIRNAYPVLEYKYIEMLNPLRVYLSNFRNLVVNGRNGKFEYSHIHDHLRDARAIVTSIEKQFDI